MFNPVPAYIDPATTAQLYAIIAGVAITLGVVFTMVRKKIGLFFRNMKIKMMESKIKKAAAKESSKQ